jgi:hypothetical protein
LRRAYEPDAQSPPQRLLERVARPGLRGGHEEEGDDCHRRGDDTETHGLSIVQASLQTSSRMGRSAFEDGP